MQLDPQTIASLTGAYVGVRLLERVFDRWFSGTDTSKFLTQEQIVALISSQFITRSDCAQCSQRGHDQLEAFRAEMRKELAPVRQLVFAMAIKMGVDVKEIRELM